MPPLRPAGKTYTPSSTGEDAISSSSGSSSGSSELPKYLRARSKLRRVWMGVSSSLNFYRCVVSSFRDVRLSLFSRSLSWWAVRRGLGLA